VGKFYRVEKVKSDHDRLRNGFVEGQGDAPRVGKPFYIVGEPLEAGYNGRLFNTSPVISIESTDDDHKLLHTESGSVYRVEVIER